MDGKINFLPMVSIITVVYNANIQLKKTVDSVISQSYENVEFIIVDGGSTDGSVEIIKENEKSISYWISEPDGGIYDAMNKGLAIASGDYVQFLNAGDFFVDGGSLKKLIGTASKQYDLIYGDIQLVATDGKEYHHHKAREFTQENLLKYGTGVLCHQAMLVHKNIVPFYSNKYKYKGELNWYFDILQLKTDLSCFHFKEPFVFYMLGGKGYQEFIPNRLEWYKILISRFGVRAVFNRSFMGFIFNDFQNRYGRLL